MDKHFLHVGENPFDFVARHIGDIDSVAIMKSLQANYNLSDAEAKCLLLSSPAFQEKFCRTQIHGRKKRGGKKYGSRNFLRKRFRLTDDEADRLIEDFWDKKDDEVSTVFLETISVERVARCQLTAWAQDVVKKELVNSRP